MKQEAEIDFSELVTIHVQEVPLDSIAYVGKRTWEWCQLPYPKHPHGCPNYGKKPNCPPNCKLFEEYSDRYENFRLVYAIFDYKRYKDLRRQAHPEWSDGYVSSVLYWQSSVKKALKEYISEHCHYDLMLGAGSGFGKSPSPEASGIYVFKTLQDLGITGFETKPVWVVYMACLLMDRKGLLADRVSNNI